MSRRVEAKKQFGQHFLVDSYYVEKIVQSMADDELEVVEIGPGLGDLTKELLNRGSVVAYEIDIDACEFLKENFKDAIEKKKLTLIEGDILEVWSKRNLREDSYKIVANLPYNIGTEIILRALRDDKCKELIVMVQKEVAEKFCAEVRDRNFSSLGILTESIGDARIFLEVPPAAFEPPPKVDSAVFRIVKNSPYYDEGFSLFLKGCFKAPRKTLLKNLSYKYDRESLETIFNDFNLKHNIRPHEVDTDTYKRLFVALKK